MTEHRVLMNVMRSDWAVHFIGPDGRTRIGPWLLLDSQDEVEKILRWGNPAAEEWKTYRESLRRWNVASVPLRLTDRKLAQLIARGEGWPWNGYELRQMKDAGMYPPKRLVTPSGRRMNRAIDAEGERKPPPPDR